LGPVNGGADYARVYARAERSTTKTQVSAHCLRYLSVSFGCSSICPVTMRVMAEMKRKANGSEADLALNGVSVSSSIAASPANIRNERIIIEFNTFRILSMFIVGYSDLFEPIGGCRFL
jgi:hypothetical protein